MHKVCNKCGKELQKQNQVYVEDYLEINKVWGYFSQRDGERHQLILCEECYNKWIDQLLIPISKLEVTEMM